MPFIAIALLIAAALGGGVSVAANTSMPGDALWGFKTTVNENVQSAFVQGDEAKANWDISVASARLDEAKQLAASGKLNADTQASITANFEAHAQDVAARVAKLEADGKNSEAADIAARWQAAIAEHSSAVAQASASQDTDVQATIAPFLSKVNGTLDDAANLSAHASAHESEQGEASDDSSESDDSSAGAGASTTVHTGTSVRGGEGESEGGIHVNADGSTVGI